jgi:plastocyanin
LLLAFLIVAVLALPTVASSDEASLPVEAINEGGGIYPAHHRWSPAQTTVTTVGVVTFTNNSTEVAHGVEWLSAVKPSCEEGEGKVPVGTTPAASATKWSGKCTFSQAGTYTFYCTVHGPEMTGTITVKNPGGPSVFTETAASITETGATLTGAVNPNGKAVHYHFEYGTNTTYGHETPEEPIEGSSEKHVSAPVSGLAPGAAYHYRLLVKDGASVIPGGDRTFTTLSPPGPPSATTDVASAVSETAATLQGTVNPDGQATEYHFEWGTSTSYGRLTSTLPAGVDHLDHAESSTLTGLASGTVYHFRVVANNASGPSSGVDREFTTSSPPLPTPTTTTTQTTPPPATPLVTPLPPQTPAPGLAVVGGSLKLTAPRHGSTVHGSVELGSTGVGVGLEVDLLAKGSSLGRARGQGSKSVRVGRLLRRSVSAGKLSFSVPLSAQARRALARRHSLALTVRITLTPALGQVVTLTRAVTLRS